MKKLLSIIITLFLIWGSISYAEILAKNTRPNPQYSQYNLLVTLHSKIQPKEHTRYTAQGRYYTEGTVITNDGNDSIWWEYSTDTISNEEPYDAMPVWVAFDDNGTPNDITDDIILGLVYDRNTAVYDELETALGDKFELTREGNNIKIGGTK